MFVPETRWLVPGTNPVCPQHVPGVIPRATGPKNLCLCAFLGSQHPLPHSVCAPLCSKNMGCASPALPGWWGSCGQQIQAMSNGPLKQQASPGEQSEAPRRRRKPGQEQNPGPENQDSQHILEQPRGYFPDSCERSCTRLRLPPVALHVSQLISLIL